MFLYKIKEILDGTFELFRQKNGESIRTMGNFDTLESAERLKKILEKEEEEKIK